MSSNKKISRKAKILPQFSIYSGNKPPLDLLEIQRKSFCDLLERGIIEELSKTDIFRETAKFSGFTQELELVFNPDTYKLVSPNCTPKEAILKGKTYACKLYVQATLTIRSSPRGSVFPAREGRELEKHPSVVPRFSLASSQPLHNEILPHQSYASLETTRKQRTVGDASSLHLRCTQSLDKTLPLKYSEKSLRYLQSLQPAQPTVSWTQGSRSMERLPMASKYVPRLTRKVHDASETQPALRYFFDVIRFLRSKSALQRRLKPQFKNYKNKRKTFKRSTTTFIGSPIIKKVVALLSNKKIDRAFEHLHLLSPFQKYIIARRRGCQLHAQSELPIERTINAHVTGAEKVQEKAALGARKEIAFSFVDSYASCARPPLVETPTVWNDVAYKGSFTDTKFFDKKANKKWNRVKKYPVLATPLSFIKSSTSFNCYASLPSGPIPSTPLHLCTEADIDRGSHLSFARHAVQSKKMQHTCIFDATGEQAESQSACSPVAVLYISDVKKKMSAFCYARVWADSQLFEGAKVIAPKVHVRAQRGREGVRPDTKFTSLICRLPKAAFDLRSPPVHKQISDIMSIAGDNQISGSEVTYGGSSTDNTDTSGIASALKRTENSDEAGCISDASQRVKIFRPWIFLGELPLMTKRGHFILNGSPRVIVNQMARCPGIYFQEKRRGVGFEQEVRVSADLIPQRGPWLRIQSDWEGRFWARLKREGRVKYATLYEAFQEFEKQYSAPLISLVTNSSSSFPKSEILAFQERKVKEDRQKKALVRFFKNSTRYSLGKQGRLRINQRVHSSQFESYSCHRQIQYRLPFESTSYNTSPLEVQSKGTAGASYKPAKRRTDDSVPVQGVMCGAKQGDATYSSAVNNSGANQLITPTPYVALLLRQKRTHAQCTMHNAQCTFGAKVQRCKGAKVQSPRSFAYTKVNASKVIAPSALADAPKVQKQEADISSAHTLADAPKVQKQEADIFLDASHQPFTATGEEAHVQPIKDVNLLKNKEKNPEVTSSLYRGKPPYASLYDRFTDSTSARKDSKELHKLWFSFFSIRSPFQRLTNLLCIENVRQFISLKKQKEKAIFALHSDSNLLGKLTAILSSMELSSCNQIRAHAQCTMHNAQCTFGAKVQRCKGAKVQSHVTSSMLSASCYARVQSPKVQVQTPVASSIQKLKIQGADELAAYGYAPIDTNQSTDNSNSLLECISFAPHFEEVSASRTDEMSASCVARVKRCASQGEELYSSPFQSMEYRNDVGTPPSTDDMEQLLMATDVNAIHLCLEHLLEGQGFTDDIDHLKNRLVRTSGKLLQQQLELGLDRLSEVMTPLLGNLMQGQLLSSLLPSQNTEKPSLHQRRASRSGHQPLKKKSGREKKNQPLASSPKVFEMHPSKSLDRGAKQEDSKQKQNFECTEGAKKDGRRAPDLEQVSASSPVAVRSKKMSASGVARVRADPMHDASEMQFLQGTDKRRTHVMDQLSASSPQEKGVRRKRETQQTPFRWLRTSKPVNNAFREFFGSNPLSQYMDQTNPLAEITHKRRLSSMGPGGIKRETAGMEVRGIHPTHYGRVCPIETPEGKNAGLVNSPTVYGRIGKDGFMETPLYQVVESQVQKERWAFFSAQQEEFEESSLATGDTGVTRFNFLSHMPIPVQTANNPLAHFQQVERNRVGYKALSPVQTISIATALIPFLEHDDANRALMGSNMQRQAIPLLSPERPIVGTGFEPMVMSESGQAIQATKIGCVSHVSANKIILESIHSTWHAPPTVRSCSVLPPYYSRIQNGDSISNIYCKFFHTREKHNNVWWNRTVFSRCVEPPFLFKVSDASSFFTCTLADAPKVQKQEADNVHLCTFALTPLHRRCIVYVHRASCKEDVTSAKKMYKVSNLRFDRVRCPLLATQEASQAVNLHISKKVSHQTATNFHLCSTQSAFLFQKVEQSLQLYQRSNQETCLSQRPLVREGDWVQKGDFLADCSASHSGDLALGKNVTVAYMPWEGYNFEDAIVISDRLVANDIYTSIHIERYEIKVSKNSQGKERITNQIPSLSPQHLKHLSSDGIARVSSWVQPGDILVGKVVELKRPLSPYERLAWELASRLSPNSPEREKWLSKVWLEDISLRLPAGVCGRVINFQIISTEWSEKEHSLIPLEVHVYLAVKRKIQVGDKLAGRHGNKGIVSIVLPRQDMPYLGDGSSIDMVLNPLGVPSRMNLGQIFECLLGLAGSQLGCNFKVTPFDEIAGGEASRSLVFLKLYQCRLIYKQQWLFTPTFPGKNKLFDGRTGEPFENWVTVGQAYMLKLIHMVDHKIHARSTGPYSLFTRQPVRGRSRRGGQRLGEMEVWAVEGFGAAYTLQEFLTIKSDDLKARAALQRSFYKKNDVTLGKVHISPGNPEAFRVLVSELQALCLHIQM